PASRWSATCPTPWTPPPRSPTRAGWAAPSWPPARSTRPPRSGCSWASRPPDPQPTERLDSTPPTPTEHAIRRLSTPTEHAISRASTPPDTPTGGQGRRGGGGPRLPACTETWAEHAYEPQHRPHVRTNASSRGLGLVHRALSGVSGRGWGVETRRPVGWEASSRGVRSGGRRQVEAPGPVREATGGVGRCRMAGPVAGFGRMLADACASPDRSAGEADPAPGCH